MTAPITAAKLIQNAIANYESPPFYRWEGLGRAMSGVRFSSGVYFTAGEQRIVGAFLDALDAAPADFAEWYDAATPEEMLEPLRLALAIVKKREARRSTGRRLHSKTGGE